VNWSVKQKMMKKLASSTGTTRLERHAQTKGSAENGSQFNAMHGKEQYARLGGAWEDMAERVGETKKKGPTTASRPPHDCFPNSPRAKVAMVDHDNWLLPSALALTATTLPFVYVRFFRRIPNADFVTPKLLNGRKVIKGLFPLCFLALFSLLFLLPFDQDRSLASEMRITSDYTTLQGPDGDGFGPCRQVVQVDSHPTIPSPPLSHRTHMQI
jgi:hypothetical protein